MAAQYNVNKASFSRKFLMENADFKFQKLSTDADDSQECQQSCIFYLL